MKAAHRFIILPLLLLFSGCASFAADVAQIIQPNNCTMTAWHQSVDAVSTEGFPERSHTGDEFILVGIVRDAGNCAPLPHTTIVFDMTNHEGEYDGTNAGSLTTNSLGYFTIQSERPGAYNNGNPHIHLFVGKDSYSPITTAYDLLTDAPYGWIEISLNIASGTDE